MENKDALDTVASTRSTLADRLVTPWWYHPILAAIIGGLIVTLGIVALRGGGPVWVPITAGAVAGLGILLLGPAYDNAVRAELRRG